MIAVAPGPTASRSAAENPTAPPPGRCNLLGYTSSITLGALPKSARFTIDGDDALELHLERTCARVLSGIQGLIPHAKLEAVLLGGGYGRGEGGVLRGPGGDRPYNDLEFYVLIAGNRHVNEFRYHRRLEVLGEILTHLADVEVEFKITSLAELRDGLVSMFSYDLIAGHRFIWGRKSAHGLPGCERHRSAESVPSAEGTRLLMNRCTGLLLASAELAREPFTPAAADFVQRNLAKVQLACGDAVLAACGQYHWSCRERHHRLNQLAVVERWPWLDTVLWQHATGVAFKLRPTTGGLSRDTLIELHREVSALALQCWLALESRRSRRAFPTARAYAEDPLDKLPGWPRLRNFFLNLKADRFRLRARPSPWWHPRQRIFRALALLLWEPATFTDPALRQRLEQELNAPASTPAEAMAAYRALWARVR